MRSLLAVVLVLGCGAKPDLASDGGTADASRAHLTIAPSSALIAAGSRQTFTVTNDGEDSTRSILLEIGGNDSTSFAISNPACTVLVPNASCTVDVANLGTAPNASAELHAMASGIDPATADLTGTGASTGLLKIAPTTPNAQFSGTPLGATSPPVSFTITNQSTTMSGPLTIALPDPFKIGGQTDHCSNTNLAAGASCTLGIEFAPLSGSPGTRSGPIMATGVPSSISGTYMLIASIILPFSVSPASGHNFGTVPTCQMTLPQQTFTITNITSSSWMLDTIAITGPDASSFTILSNNCQSTGPSANQSCSVTVGVIPNSNLTPGPRTAALQISVTAFGNTATLSPVLAMMVTACATNTLSINPTTQDFASSVGSTVTMPFVVKTTAPTGPLTVSITPPFVVASNDCSTLAAAGATCTINVSFTGAGPGSPAVLGTLTVMGTPGGMAAASLTGNSQ